MKEILPPQPEELDPQSNSSDQNDLEFPNSVKETVVTADQIPKLLKTDQEITLISDLSDGQTAESQIPLSSGSVQRLLDVIQDKDIPYLKLAIGGVAITVALGYGIKKGRIVKEKVDEFLVEKRIASLDNKQMEDFSELVSQNYDVIHRYLSRNLIGDAKAAEDLRDDVFRRALTFYSTFSPREDLHKPGRTWLFKIAFNLLKNHYRSEARKKRKEDYLTKQADISELEETGFIPHNLNAIHSLEFQIPEEPFVLDRMRELIEQLPNDRKQLITLKLEFGLTNAEIGYIIGRSEGAIKSLYHRTKSDLRKQLEDQKGIELNDFT